MTIKSIIDIEVLDTEFKRFSSLFAKYSEQLAKTPNAWKEAGKEQAAMASRFERMVAASAAHTSVVAAQHSENVEQLRMLTVAERTWSSISRHSSLLYRNVLGIGLGIAKWGGIVGGIATGASLFGLDRMAHSIAGTRQTAMAFGVSPAQLQAFGVNFERIIDPNSYLSTMTSMETDISQRRAWYSLMGGRSMSGDTTKDAIALLNAARQFALTTPKELLGTRARALGLPFSDTELMKMRGTPNKEWRGLVSGATRDVAAFGLSDRAASAWQGFSTTMHKNAITMADRLAIALGGLTGPLSKLSSAITEVAVKALGSQAVKDGIKTLSDWLGGLAKGIGGKAFGDGLKTFENDIEVLVGGVHKLAGGVRLISQGWENIFGWFGVGADKVSGFEQASHNTAWNAGTTLMNMFKSNAAVFAGMDARHGLPSGTSRFLADQNEGADDPDKLAALFGGEMSRYKGDLHKALAAYSLGPGGSGDRALASLMGRYPRNWEQHLSSASQQFVSSGSVAITITDATGGSSHVAFAGMAGH